jgi:hypothetical protein
MAMAEVTGQRRDGTPSANASALLEPLGTALLKLPEPERIRLLGTLLIDLAGRQEAGSPVAGSETEALGKKLHRLGEEKAVLQDELAAAQADLARRAKQVEAEQQRSGELERIVNDQRVRLQSAQKDVGELEEQLVAKNRLQHATENQIEALTLRAERAERKSGDTSGVESLEDDKRTLAVQVDQLRSDLERLRGDKDREIEEVKSAAELARPEAAEASGAVLGALWQRLARGKPVLVQGGARPTPQAAERLIDAFLEMARFVSDFDQGLRPFLGSFIKHNQALARPWDVYARSPALQDVVREVIDVEHGKPAGVLKMRLLGLQRWTLAAIIGADTAIECIANELETQLRGSAGLAADPNRKVRDYLREDGHHKFQEKVRELRGQKLAEAYTHAQGG